MSSNAVGYPLDVVDMTAMSKIAYEDTLQDIENVTIDSSSSIHYIYYILCTYKKLELYFGRDLFCNSFVQSTNNETIRRDCSTDSKISNKW